ncbi:MAG TPA: 50S ribosomal protein L29 [Candidatus Wildermuthbacteria bacterium]|nr:50S ribosomal protein L29 [Candidatus Wildermuthbacteria bacterium]
MKAVDLRKKTKVDLRRQLLIDKEKLQSLRFDIVAGKVKNVKEIRTRRKEIATIMTILSEK